MQTSSAARHPLWIMLLALLVACAPGRLEVGDPITVDTVEPCGATCADACVDCGEPCQGAACDPEPTLCGDARCDASESCAECPADCGACAAVCGDTICGPEEDCETCPQDCGICAPQCGDGTCDGDETCQICPQDCGVCAPVCGDGICEAGETCDACPQDCGACPPVCGDGVCEAGETCDACPNDCGACGWPEGLARSEEALLVMVNELRSAGTTCGGSVKAAVGPLVMNAELRQAARLHSQDMGDNNYFNHTGLNGSSFSQRARAAGYNASPGGENIAAGNGTAQATFQQWHSSPGHCENMMRGRFNEIGVGHAQSAGSQYGHYWTQVFGNR